ncbi:MAG TPA: TatD family hydrolase [Myxococcota bacterium]|nr:TatD family hydrolase [Myxococcota bacterium]
MIDSHCHLDVDRFDDDRPAVIERAADAGVHDIVVPAVDEASWDVIADLASKTTALRVHATAGVHPLVVPALDAADDDSLLARLDTRAARGGIVAIGECGLDDTIDMTRAPYARQEALLRGHFAIAARHHLPLVLHARGRGAYVQLAAFLDTCAVPSAGAVLHSYGGGIDLLKRFREHQLYFGFAGPATYPNARKVRASIVDVDDAHLLAETDAPDQTPEPHRPGRSEPAYVAEIIAAMAKARRKDIAELSASTTANARRLFRLPP